MMPPEIREKMESICAEIAMPLLRGMVSRTDAYRMCLDSFDAAYELMSEEVAQYKKDSREILSNKTIYLQSRVESLETALKWIADYPESDKYFNNSGALNMKLHAKKALGSKGDDGE